MSFQVKELKQTRVQIHRPMALVPLDAALERAQYTSFIMKACDLCAFRCRVDRTRGPAGACRSDSITRVFYEGIEWAGEDELVPTYVISLSGCNMTCSFCLTGASSQNGKAGQPLDPDAVADRICNVASNLRSVTILGGEPIIHLDGALEIVARIPDSLKIVWKTNAYASARGLGLLQGIPHVVLAEYKFGNDECARRLAGIPQYTDTVHANLRWAKRTSRLIVRHLLMPSHFECCFIPVVTWLQEEMPGTPISLMIGFLPVFHASRYPELARTNRPSEASQAYHKINELGLEMARWTLAPVLGVTSAQTDEIWIDRNGRICVDSASAELVAVLKKIKGEFPEASSTCFAEVY